MLTHEPKHAPTHAPPAGIGAAHFPVHVPAHVLVTLPLHFELSHPAAVQDAMHEARSAGSGLHVGGYAMLNHLGGGGPGGAAG